jgi:hypothetical protein
MGVMHTEMKREIPTAVKKPPKINLGHTPQTSLLIYPKVAGAFTCNYRFPNQDTLRMDYPSKEKSPPHQEAGLL